MDEGIWKILFFRKMADVEIQSWLFDQNFTYIFGYKKKNRPKKNPSSIRRTIIYKIIEKIFKLNGQAVLKLQWSSTLKTWFREKRVLSFEYDLHADRDDSIQSHLSPLIKIRFVWNFQRILLKYSTFRKCKKIDFFKIPTQNSNNY